MWESSFIEINNCNCSKHFLVFHRCIMCYTFLRSTLGAIEFSISCRLYKAFQIHAQQLFVVPSRVLESLACESNIPPFGWHFNCKMLNCKFDPHIWVLFCSWYQKFRFLVSHLYLAVCHLRGQNRLVHGFSSRIFDFDKKKFSFLTKRQ